MTRRRLTTLVLVLVALAASALLIAFARGVAAVEYEVAALDSTTGRVEFVRQPDAPAFGPADSVAQALLGASDDIEFRRALGLVEESRRFAHVPNQVLEFHAEAIALLQRLDGEPAERASRASAMIGALRVEDAIIDVDASPRYRQLATEAFQAAVRLDPTNEAAKLGLELLLGGSSSASSRIGQEGSGGGVTGAGESLPGTGY